MYLTFFVIYQIFNSLMKDLHLAQKKISINPDFFENRQNRDDFHDMGR